MKPIKSGMTMGWLPQAQFMDTVFNELIEMGHKPRTWMKGRWGFNTVCLTCGAHTSVTKTTRRVREFPDDTCDERQALVRS